MNVNDRQLRESAAEWHPSSTSNAEVSNQANTDGMACEAKEERKIQVKREWITPNDHARAGNHMKTHDNNEDCENENRCDELSDDDSDDEEEEACHCDVKKEKKQQQQR